MNKFYPVIHIKSVDHAMRNAEIAARECADGIFLINMGDAGPGVFRDSFDQIGKMNLGIRLGMNLLDDLSEVPDDLPPDTMIWSDHLRGYHEGVRRYTFFGPYAFKYQKQPVNLVAELPAAEALMDVVTTSGKGTGEPPMPEKIVTMYAVATKPLAIASGISIDNVKQFKPYVEYFLVGSSIGYHNLIPERVSELANAIHQPLDSDN